MLRAMLICCQAKKKKKEKQTPKKRAIFETNLKTKPQPIDSVHQNQKGEKADWQLTELCVLHTLRSVNESDIRGIVTIRGECGAGDGGGRPNTCQLCPFWFELWLFRNALTTTSSTSTSTSNTYLQLVANTTKCSMKVCQWSLGVNGWLAFFPFISLLVVVVGPRRESDKFDVLNGSFACIEVSIGES